MAKKKSAIKKSGAVNKSEAIRNYLRGKPKAGPKEIAAELGKDGVDVTPGFVSTIKTDFRKKKGRKGRKKGAGGGRPADDRVSLSALVQAKKMVDDIGGIDKAKNAIDALARLQ